MEKKISNELLLNTLQQRFEELAGNAWNDIVDGTEASKVYYKLSTHSFLRRGEENSAGWPREVILPLPKEEWPEKFSELEKRYDSQMTWPNYAMYLYIMDVFCPPFIPECLLHFGYAIYKDKLIRCPFFVVFQMTEQTINEENIMLPEAFAIDPLASMCGITPDCYIGVNVKKKYVEEWFFSRGATGHPLENYVDEKRQKEHKEKLYDSYMEAYNLQMTYEPGWFPQQLIDFAQKEGLYIPKQDRDDTYLKKEEDNEPIQKSAFVEKSKKIFLLRHAEYSGRDKDPHLSNYGKQQAKKLAGKIMDNIHGFDGRVTIWTSTANRAKETAQIIRENFEDYEFVQYEKLWSDSDHSYDFKWFEEELSSFKGNILIVISHLEYVQQFPEWLGFPENNASYAQGVLIENDDTCTNFG